MSKCYSSCMAPSCTYDLRSQCPESPVIGFDMCIAHLKTGRGLAHARERLESGALFTYRDLEEEIRSRTEAPLKDYHTTALEQMAVALEEQQRFTENARQMLYRLPPGEWRYTDRHGTEQTRMEVTMYEKAMAATARLVRETAKISLQEKVVSLGRAQTELVIRLIMGTLEDLGLDSDDFDRARAILLDKFRKEAHLSARHEAQVENELEIKRAKKAIV